MYIVRGLTVDGMEFFYTGKAGEAFVNADIKTAFTYQTLEGAKRRALDLNRMTAIHGYRFIAVKMERFLAYLRQTEG